MLVCVIHTINGVELLVWEPMAQRMSRAQLVPKRLVNEMFVRVWDEQSVQLSPGTRQWDPDRRQHP